MKYPWVIVLNCSIKKPLFKTSLRIIIVEKADERP